jgi:hypothetical protein
MISAYYNGSVRKALLDVFPTIGLVKSKFWPKRVLSSHSLLFSPLLVAHSFNILFTAIWHDAKNRREFFQNFAIENRFDFLVAANWYSLTREKIMSAKVSPLLPYPHFKLIHYLGGSRGDTLS